MSQPISGSQWFRISGTIAGTTVVLDRPGVLSGLFSGANKTGTIDFYDVASASGTTATNFITSVQNTTGTIPFHANPNVQLRYGLVAVKGGTTDMLALLD